MTKTHSSHCFKRSSKARKGGRIFLGFEKIFASWEARRGFVQPWLWFSEAPNRITHLFSNLLKKVTRRYAYALAVKRYPSKSFISECWLKNSGADSVLVASNSPTIPDPTARDPLQFRFFISQHTLEKSEYFRICMVLRMNILTVIRSFLS